MKKLLLGTIGLVALGMAAAPASAADLAARPYTKAPAPMIAAIYDWSGFYIGANGGWGSSRKCWDLQNNLGTPFSNVAEGCHEATGGTAGGQIGYRWQASSWVFGLEAQGNWADFKGSNTNLTLIPAAVGGPISDRSKIDAFGLFTGQIGYAWNNALVYVKGGAAVTNDKYSTSAIAGNVVIDRATETRWGGAIGGGVEFGFAPNWSVGVEYDHLFMGSRNVTSYGVGNFGIATGAFSSIDRIRQDVDLATVRVNYRWGGPLIAKY
ncbi:MAG: outer rane immunogenic protein [Bradyrhizobium sp.]|jgi:outer membrane immunogenic protein|nr:outer rane immunogenic protein [Bradyrhizobium sp.]